jgi:hypothetical protein
MQNVLSKITVLYALVKMVTLAIHSVDAIPIHVRTDNTNLFINTYKKKLLQKIAPAFDPPKTPYRNPCVPSPCGPNSQCQVNGESPSCSCLSTYIGSPPNCRPECSINSDCPSNKACINEKCRDPCPGSCGISADCHVTNHIPICTCIQGYTGDPFTNCYPTPEQSEIQTIINF